jgi:uncharacterized protein YebE (UPF0316 family)
MEIFILCIKIFFVRIIDVSLGTFRTITTVKGKKLFSSFVGFIEVLIWFLIVKEALNNETNSIWVAIAYSLGFATGTYIGGILSDKFIQGNLSIQVILSDNNESIINEIRKSGYAVSVMNIKGQEKERYMLLIEIDKDDLNHLTSIIKKLDQKAFIIVNETKMVQNGFIK